MVSDQEGPELGEPTREEFEDLKRAVGELRTLTPRPLRWHSAISERPRENNDGASDLEAHIYRDTGGAIVGEIYDREARIWQEVFRSMSGGDFTRDAFSRFRVSTPVNRFHNQFQYDKYSILWEETVSGSGTVTLNADESSLDLTVTSGTDSAEMQTREYMRYQPGKGGLVMLTATFGTTGTANLTQRLGYHDDDNGLFFEMTSAGIAVVERSKVTGSVVNESVAQADWNLDTLNGAGSATDRDGNAFNLDFTKSQVFVIDFEWLSVGRIRWGFFLEGRPVYCHEITHLDAHTASYMTTANLPLRYQIVSSGGVGTLTALCQTVDSEAGFTDEQGIPFHQGMSGAGTNVGSTLIPILSIRPKATFNSIVNRGQILLDQFHVLAITEPIHLNVVYNGTLTGASFGSVNNDSIVEFDTAASAISGGISISGDFVPAGQAKTGGTSFVNLVGRLPIVLDRDGANPIPVTVAAARADAAGTAVVSAGLQWREVR